MKILNQHIARMYVITIILFIVVTAISSYDLKQPPYALIVAVALTSLIEVVVTKFYLKQNAKIPFSAIITGFIIGSVAIFTIAIYVVYKVGMVKMKKM